MKKLGKKIKGLRENSGLSQAKLAKKLKMTAAFICRLENGDYRTVSVASLLKFSKFFKVSIAYLAGEISLETSNKLMEK